MYKLKIRNRQILFNDPYSLQYFLENNVVEDPTTFINLETNKSYDVGQYFGAVNEKDVKLNSIGLKELHVTGFTSKENII